MKRALIFSLQYHPFVGGAEVAIKEITDRIKGIEFHLLTIRFDSSLPKEEKIGNVHVHRIGFGRKGASVTETHHPLFYISKVLFIPLAVFSYFSLTRKYQFDFFWCMMSYMVFPVVLLRIFKVKVPYVLTLQEGDPFEHVFHRWFIAPFKPLLVSGFKNASEIQVISSFLGEWAKKEGYKGEPMRIPNGVSIIEFTKPSKPADIEKKEGEVWLITTSRLVHKNAIDDVIRAMAELPDVHFLVLGTGPLEEELKILAGKLGVRSRVHFKGFVPYEEILSYYRAADIFIRPSRSEGMGNSFIEAMAAGIPVIGTSEGGIRDFLFDRKTGWVVKKDTPSDIVSAVQAIISNKEERKTILAAASHEVKEEYDWKTIASRMEKLFSTLQ